MSDLLTRLEGVGALDHTDESDPRMGRSARSMKLQTVRERHKYPKNTDIDGVEYGEVQKDGFTHIYVNGDLGCIVTWRNWNDEVILWPDYHTENWENGEFRSIQYDSVAYSYNSPEGKAEWQSMWERDEEWCKKAKEFYIEVNETKSGNKYREGVWGDRPAPRGD